MRRPSVQSNIIESTPTTLKDFALSNEREATLRQANANLARQLERVRNGQDELIRAVHSAIDTAAASLEIPRVPKPIYRSGKSHGEEKAILCVGDMQLAKVTPTYNTAVCEARMERYAQAVASITKIMRSDHPVNDAHIHLLGDIIEGEMIFPHQAHQIDSGLYTQLMVDAPRILINFIRQMLTVFRHIHITAIPGNHGQFGGRGWKAYSPETNADRMLYRLLQGLLANEPRVTWQIPYARHESAWYAVDYPFGREAGHGILMFHGNQIPNVGSASTGTIARRIWGFSAGAIAEPFEIVEFGHWHTPKYIPLNKIHVFCNGSTESTNIYAQERLSAIGQPVQLMYFMSPKRGITAQYWLQLEPKPVTAEQSYDLPAIEPYTPVTRGK